MLFKLRVEIEDVTVPALTAPGLDVIVDSGALKDDAVVIDLADGERALVWIEGRLADVLNPDLYAYWTVMKNVRVELVDATKVRFDSTAHAKVLALPRTASLPGRRRSGRTDRPYPP